MTFTIEQADALARVVRENTHPSFTPGDDDLSQIRISEMADGKGGWGVFITTIDVAGHEQTWRHVVDAAGRVTETLLGEEA